MALRQKDNLSYGDSQADIREELAAQSGIDGYPVEHFADAICQCRGHIFKLFIDDDEGAAIRECVSCKQRHPMGDSEDNLEDASLSQCECPCGNDALEVTVGVALHEGREDVRWLYMGCRCPRCGLVACYGDWKNEFIDYKELLKRV